MNERHERSKRRACANDQTRFEIFSMLEQYSHKHVEHRQREREIYAIKEERNEQQKEKSVLEQSKQLKRIHSEER